MDTSNAEFLLTCTDGDAQGPVLQGVEAVGHLDGTLFELSVRQSYRNTTDRNLEVFYTFPLPSQAVLLGFASELNGSRMQGQIVRKQHAEQQYEQALSDGDAPVMLEALGDGLHTANIGNLQPGDELVIELRFAQLLSFEQGRLRLGIPTTIAPRYGNPAAAGLQPQQAPGVSIVSAYPLKLSIGFGKAFDAATVECLTHRMRMDSEAEGTRYALEPGAWLDRDLVMSVQLNGPSPALLVCATDSANAAAPVVKMAVFQPQIDVPRSSIALRVLVDCSGSMAGDSLTSARSVLNGMLNVLSDQDTLSLSRFGSSVEHMLSPNRCSPDIKRWLVPAVARMEADLGGTEMELALRAVFELKTRDQDASADILLLTDGEIWEADAVIASARASRHRIFVIGLGASPTEGVLRRLAETTGGAAEFVTPGEAFEAAARRMLTRMRQPRHSGAKVEWGAEPVWQTELPINIFGGDTVIAFAGFDGAPSPQATTRLVGNDEQGRTVMLSAMQGRASSTGDTLARMAAARRLASSEGSRALALALNYQLLSSETHCILVHVRAANAKATEDAKLHQVQSMLAAGWGGTATVMAAQSVDAVFEPPAFLRRQALDASLDIRFSPADSDAGLGAVFESLAPARLLDQSGQVADATLRELAEAVLSYLVENNGALTDLDAHCETMSIHDDLRAALDAVCALAPDASVVWLLLAHWINSRRGGLANDFLATTLRPHLSRLESRLIDEALRLFEQSLGLFGNDDWTSSRQHRLARSLGRVVV
jgi:Ca-activated chloride channel family protein